MSESDVGNILYVYRPSTTKTDEAEDKVFRLDRLLGRMLSPDTEASASGSAEDDWINAQAMPDVAIANSRR